ncbi:MAG: helix-turn-helix domain-containing protein [Rhodoferax sp.]|nr:helix-turn-helix domain-containing protein [Rhodoferax sp.]MBP9734495.1 helix-turn-helix domain-containing protein [Rhodoferax sp.]
MRGRPNCSNQVSVVAKQLGLSRATVYRILKSPNQSVACFKAWGQPQ